MVRNLIRDLMPYGLAVRYAARRERARRDAVAARVSQMRRSVDPARAAAKQPRLNVGCGTHVEPGWWNVDADPRAEVQHWVEVGVPLPFDTASVDVVFSEHFIEHIPIEAGVWFIKEAARVLRPGGVWRSSTPDFDWIVASAKGEWRALASVYEDIGDFKPGELTRPSETINWAFRGHGHQYLWSLADFERHLAGSGFTDVKRVAHGQSRMPGAAIETREHEAFYSLIVEATRA